MDHTFGLVVLFLDILKSDILFAQSFLHLLVLLLDLGVALLDQLDNLAVLLLQNHLRVGLLLLSLLLFLLLLHSLCFDDLLQISHLNASLAQNLKQLVCFIFLCCAFSRQLLQLGILQAQLCLLLLPLLLAQSLLVCHILVQNSNVRQQSFYPSILLCRLFCTFCLQHLVQFVHLLKLLLAVRVHLRQLLNLQLLLQGLLLHLCQLGLA